LKYDNNEWGVDDQGWSTQSKTITIGIDSYQLPISFPADDEDFLAGATVPVDSGSPANIPSWRGFQGQCALEEAVRRRQVRAPSQGAPQQSPSNVKRQASGWNGRHAIPLGHRLHHADSHRCSSSCDISQKTQSSSQNTARASQIQC